MGPSASDAAIWWCLVPGACGRGVGAFELGATNTRVGELIGIIFRTLFFESAMLLEST